MSLLASSSNLPFEVDPVDFVQVDQIAVDIYEHQVDFVFRYGEKPSKVLSGLTGLDSFICWLGLTITLTNKHLMIAYDVAVERWRRRPR